MPAAAPCLPAPDFRLPQRSPRGNVTLGFREICEPEVLQIVRAVFVGVFGRFAQTGICPCRVTNHIAAREIPYLALGNLASQEEFGGASAVFLYLVACHAFRRIAGSFRRVLLGPRRRWQGYAGMRLSAKRTRSGEQATWEKLPSELPFGRDSSFCHATRIGHTLSLWGVKQQLQTTITTNNTRIPNDQTHKLMMTLGLCGSGMILRGGIRGVIGNHRGASGHVFRLLGSSGH